MNWEELSFLVKEGVEIGSHTLTHPFLTKIPPAEARREIEDSKKLLEDKLALR
jgi:Polysaccharide deacetylase.